MGFKHNYQALRVLTSLEVKYPDIDGLNLTYEVMEGAWKHTKIKKDGELLYSLDDFFLYPNSEYLYPCLLYTSNWRGIFLLHHHCENECHIEGTILENNEKSCYYSQSLRKKMCIRDRFITIQQKKVQRLRQLV